MKIVIINDNICTETNYNFENQLKLYYFIKKLFKAKISELYYTAGTAYVLFADAPALDNHKLIELSNEQKEELLNYKLYKKAEDLVKIWHGKQIYGGFIPYFYHLHQTDKVINAFGEDIAPSKFFKTKTAALLHDVLEDTQITYDELENIFGKEIADAVLKVTKINEDDTKQFESSYYAGMASSTMAVIVKIADKAANSKQTLKDKSLWHAKRIVNGHPLFVKYTYEHANVAHMKKYLNSLILKLEKIIE